MEGIKLTESQRWFIANALRIAAEVYQKDAKLLGDANNNLEEVFTEYANRAISFAEAFEAARGAEIL